MTYEVEGQFRYDKTRTIPTPPEEIKLYMCGNIARRTISGAYVCSKCNQFWGDITNECYKSFLLWKQLKK